MSQTPFVKKMTELQQASVDQRTPKQNIAFLRLMADATESERWAYARHLRDAEGNRRTIQEVYEEVTSRFRKARETLQGLEARRKKPRKAS